jgi:protein SCO1
LAATKLQNVFLQRLGFSGLLPLHLKFPKDVMSRKSLFYIIFFSLLVLGFYLVVITIIPHPKPDYPAFSFTNQDGKTITERDVAGKVYAVNYFFTTCRGTCPKMNGNMKKVYDHFKNVDGFLILSHTSDPAVDSPAKLRKYADSLKVSTDKWIFLTGRKDSLYYKARFRYGIDDPANNVKNPDDDFLHTQFVALVDKDGKVTKIYDGLKPVEINELISDADRLLKNN